MEIKNITVIGSGEMGHGIAEVFAIRGYNVVLEDVSSEILDRAIKGIKESLEKLEKKGSLGKETVQSVMSRIKTNTSIADGVKDADLVVEAVPEIEDLKKEIFQELEKSCRNDTIFASNTSNIRITDIANNLHNRDRVAGLHFFNPPVILKLVEVIKGEETSDEVVDTLYSLVKNIGKYPVRVMKDVPGFIVNRVNAPGGLLICLTADSKIAGPEEIDAFMKSQGLPMGPFELTDYVGVDVAYHSMEYLARTVNPDYRKCKLFEDMYNKKMLGMKTGRGFYDWSKGRPIIDMKKATDKVSLMDQFSVEINEAVKLIDDGVASPEDIEAGIKLGLNRPFGPISVAKTLTNAEIKERLDNLVKKFGNSVFEPAESIKNGRMRDAIEGRVGKKREKDSQTQEAKKPAESESDTPEKFETIILEKFPYKVARITLNRPKYNTISRELIQELESAIRMLWDDNEVNVVIVTGKGDILTSGADLSGYSASGFHFLENSRKGERTFALLSEIPKLTMVVMKGYALGGGLEMSLACDLRIATEDVKIGFPEVTRGLVPGWGGSQRLARVIGLGRAMELTLTGKRITGKEAYDLGLVNRISNDPDNFALEYARSIAETSAPIALALAKRLVNKGTEVPTDIGLEMEAMAAGIVFTTDDLKEGISAFFEKRKPVFKGK